MATTPTTTTRRASKPKTVVTSDSMDILNSMPTLLRDELHRLQANTKLTLRELLEHIRELDWTPLERLTFERDINGFTTTYLEWMRDAEMGFRTNPNADTWRAFKRAMSTVRRVGDPSRTHVLSDELRAYIKRSNESLLIAAADGRRAELSAMCANRIHAKKSEKKWEAVEFYAIGQYVADTKNEDGDYVYTDQQVTLALECCNQWVKRNGPQSGADKIMRGIIGDLQTLRWIKDNLRGVAIPQNQEPPRVPAAAEEAQAQSVNQRAQRLLGEALEQLRALYLAPQRCEARTRALADDLLAVLGRTTRGYNPLSVLAAHERATRQLHDQVQRDEQRRVDDSLD